MAHHVHLWASTAILTLCEDYSIVTNISQTIDRCSYAPKIFPFINFRITFWDFLCFDISGDRNAK